MSRPLPGSVIARIQRLIAAGETVEDVADAVGVTPLTVQKYRFSVPDADAPARRRQRKPYDRLPRDIRRAIWRAIERGDKRRAIAKHYGVALGTVVYLRNNPPGDPFTAAEVPLDDDDPVGPWHGTVRGHLAHIWQESTPCPACADAWQESTAAAHRAYMSAYPPARLTGTPIRPSDYHGRAHLPARPTNTQTGTRP